MNYIINIFTTLIMCFSFSANAQVLAKIGKETITVKDFNQQYKEAIQSSTGLAPTKKQFLEDLIRFRVGLKEAQRRKLSKNPMVKKALNQELYKGLLEVTLAKQVEKIKVTEGDMRKFYSKNPEVRSSHILVRYPINASEKQIAEAKARIDKIYSDVMTKKKKWKTYTRLYSEDELNKKSGGDIGYHSVTTLHPNYYNTAKALKIGQISKPVRSVYGFHIIKLTGKNSYARADKARLKIRVFNDKRVALLNNYFSKVKKKYPISVNSNLLK